MAPSQHGENGDDRPAGRPLPEGESFYTPGAGPLRQAVERRSALPLVWLHQAPRWILPVALGLVLIAGLMVPGPVGALLLVVLSLFFAWLAFLAWPSITAGQRLLRMVAVAVLLALALGQLGAF